MRPLVVDASAALQLVLPEPGASRVRTLVAEGRAGIFVPYLFWLEIVNALSRRQRWEGRRVLEAVYEYEQLGLVSVSPDRASVIAVIDLVDRFSLTPYDAAYLALALGLDADLATADRALAGAAGERAILIESSHKLAERSLRYGDVSWPNWQGAAHYLSELRAQVLSE